MTEPRYLLDTNICIYLFDAASLPLRARVSACVVGELAISAIVLAELTIGVARHEPSAIDQIEHLLRIAPALPFDEAAARAYGKLPFKRAKFDRLIAAHALARDLTLVTANTGDFADVTGLRVEDWTRP
ncbi:ribonuclease VapC [Polymorphobacter glacialis]|uniref:Ribonuclease VapC n=1 Tax=Sandarakinorhabdus glacialis TaxID=1614636 RepID=A0A916ZNU3_9SPHN|nr:type II toxin-antitoxin system VapC family toxin [Polymorphobacter glacialis]GGE06853.1 ribonuclease VapC [Polymorphobacter glacialis]